MEEKAIIVVGAGGHSKVATEIIESHGWRIAGYIDEGNQNSFLNKPVYKSLNDAELSHPGVSNAFIAIGSAEARKKWFTLLNTKKYALPYFVHERAWVSKSAVIEEGVLICANAVIGTEARIGTLTIVNSNAVLDHDSSVGAFSHLSQGVIVAGGCSIGSHVLLSIGCTVEKMSTISDGTSLPASTNFASAR